MNSNKFFKAFKLRHFKYLNSISKSSNISNNGVGRTSIHEGDWGNMSYLLPINDKFIERIIYILLNKRCQHFLTS